MQDNEKADRGIIPASLFYWRVWQYSICLYDGRFSPLISASKKRLNIDKTLS